MKRPQPSCLSSVAISLEMEPELENVVHKLTPEASFVGELPLAVDNFESDVFVGRSGVEFQDRKVGIVAAWREEILRSRALVDLVREENVELVSLNDFWRGLKS